jgi:integral membrane protein (TIGR01906 family)
LKIVKLFFDLIFIICLPFVLLSGSLAWGFNSSWLYNYGFEKYHVSASTGLSETELNQAAEALIKYFNSNDEYINVVFYHEGKPFELFTMEEKIHFKDVKQLIKLDYLIFYITLLYILIYIMICLYWKKGKYRIQLAKNLIWGSGIAVTIVILIGLASFFDFDSLFLQFHYLVFSNTFWSAPGYMLLLFPGGFWYDAAVFCLGFMLILALFIGFLALFYFKLLKRKEFNNIYV